MKLLRVISRTPIQSTLSSQSDSSSYEEIFEKLRFQALLYPSGFKRQMEKLGWKIFETIPDDLFLQKKWASEQGIQYNPSVWREQLFLKQLEFFRPSILYFERGSAFSIFSDSFRCSLKKQYPFLKVVVGSWGTTGVNCIKYLDVDHMFSMDAVFDHMFKQHQISSEICYHCFDEEAVHVLPPCAEKVHDFVFLGVSGYGYSDHRDRYFDLLWLLNHSPLKIWCDEATATSARARFRKKLIHLLSYLPTFTLNLMEQRYQSSRLSHLLEDAILYKARHPSRWYLQHKPLRQQFQDRVQNPLFGLAYLQVLRSAKIVLNRHVDMQEHYGNMRVFEACGMGACLLTDRGKTMQHLFEPDREIATYSSRQECLEKMQFLLSNSQTREEMARMAQQRVLKEHTFAKRSLQIHEALKNLIYKK